MNKIVIKGNIANDISYRKSESGITYASFNIAVKRDFKNKEGKYDTDFFNCRAFRTTADFINKYYKKGDEMLFTGNLTTRSYIAKDGTKKYITEIIIENTDFTYGNKNKTESDEVVLTEEDIAKVFGNEEELLELPF